MHAHLVQLDIAWEDKPANHRRVRERIAQAPTNPGDLIVLPELFDVGFTLNTAVARDDDGVTLAFLQALADETGCTVHGSRATMPAGSAKAHNNATVCAPGLSGPLCEYAKVHPFSFGREREAYTGGGTLTHYDWAGLHVCPAVCYDLRFPELFRLGAKDGAQVFVLGANWPTHRIDHWRALCIARAIENQAFVLGVNRCGNDPHLPYPGGTIAIDPRGQILAEMDAGEGIASVEIDPGVLDAWRATFPALNDMRLI